jgi:hypothetical protein
MNGALQGCDTWPQKVAGADSQSSGKRLAIRVDGSSKGAVEVVSRQTEGLLSRAAGAWRTQMAARRRHADLRHSCRFVLRRTWEHLCRPWGPVGRGE